MTAIALTSEELLALRLARVGLAERRDVGVPYSDFARDAALHSVVARVDSVTRETLTQGRVFAHTLRGAIHLVPEGEQRVYGQALVGESEKELAAQIRRESVEHFEAVTEAAGDALKGGRRLTRDELHDEFRARLPKRRLTWCPSCGSHHVRGGLWRYALVRLGAVLDEQRRHRIPRQPARPDAHEPARRFQHFYPGAEVGDFAAWAGVTASHARRLWVEPGVVEESPPTARGVRLLPPGDPYLQVPNRKLLAPDRDRHKFLFRAVGSPGVVLQDGRLAGAWKRKKGRATVVESYTRIRKGDLDEEVERLLAL